MIFKSLCNYLHCAGMMFSRCQLRGFRSLNTYSLCCMSNVLPSTLSYISSFILLQNLPENFNDCRLKKKGLVKRVQVSFLFFFLISPFFFFTAGHLCTSEDGDSCWLGVLRNRFIFDLTTTYFSFWLSVTVPPNCGYRTVALCFRKDFKRANPSEALWFLLIMNFDLTQIVQWLDQWGCFIKSRVSVRFWVNWIIKSKKWKLN